MKKIIVLALVLSGATSAALAVKFNPEAMKAMQQEGNKIADQALKLRPYRLPTGQCLHAGGDLKTFPANVIALNCNGTPNQNWRFDTAGKFLNQSGRCLEVAEKQNVRIAACADVPRFKWKPGTDGRVSHASGLCLTANIQTSNVVVTPCKGGANQQWR